jgi:hypothetical protein
MGAAALPMAIGMAGLSTVSQGFQQAQAREADEQRARELKRQSRRAREQAEYQKAMSERRSEEVRRKAEEQKDQAKRAHERMRAAQRARMGASGFSGGSPLDSLSDSRLTEELQNIEAGADYQAGNSLLTGANAAWNSMEQARGYQYEADKARPTGMDQAKSLLSSGQDALDTVYAAGDRMQKTKDWDLGF